MEKTIKTLTEQINRLPEKSYHVSELYFDNMSITDIRLTGTETINAKITADICKRYLTNKPFKKIKKYWNEVFLKSAKNQAKTNIEKAIHLIEFYQDLRNSYEHSEIEQINYTIDTLLEQLITTKTEKSENEFRIKVSFKDGTEGYAIVSNLLSAIYTNERIRKELDAHDLKGKFKDGIPYKIETTRRIRLE